MDSSMTLTHHNEPRPGQTEQFATLTWAPFFQFLISKCFNPIDQQGLSVNRNLLDLALGKHQQRFTYAPYTWDNPQCTLTKPLMDAIAQPYGTQKVIRRPSIRDNYLTALALFILETKGLDGFTGDVTRDHQHLRFVPADKLVWYVKIVGAHGHNCMGQIILVHSV